MSVVIDKRTDKRTELETLVDFLSVLKKLTEYSTDEEFAEAAAKRKVARTEDVDEDGNWFAVDTCFVDDRDWVFETAVSHEKYNDGNWMIVDGCNVREIAEAHHQVWVDYMKKNKPVAIKDFRADITYLRDDIEEVPI